MIHWEQLKYTNAHHIKDLLEYRGSSNGILDFSAFLYKSQDTFRITIFYKESSNKIEYYRKVKHFSNEQKMFKYFIEQVKELILKNEPINS